MFAPILIKKLCICFAYPKKIRENNFSWKKWGKKVEKKVSFSGFHTQAKPIGYPVSLVSVSFHRTLKFKLCYTKKLKRMRKLYFVYISGHCASFETKRKFGNFWGGFLRVVKFLTRETSKWINYFYVSFHRRTLSTSK